MKMSRLLDRLYLVPMGSANAYLIEGEDGLTLIDAGFPKKEAVVFAAIEQLGRKKSDLKHLVLTHAHPDHVGSAAALVRATGARTYLHPLDIEIAERGGPYRAMTPAPGLLRPILIRMFFDKDARLEPVAIDQPMTDGETLPIAGGLDVVHVPGHCAGQVALLWRPGRMLIGADAFWTMTGLGDPLGFEDLALGRASQRKLAGLSFDAAGFGHGKPIMEDAAGRVRRWVGGVTP